MNHPKLISLFLLCLIGRCVHTAPQHKNLFSHSHNQKNAHLDYAMQLTTECFATCNDKISKGQHAAAGEHIKNCQETIWSTGMYRNKKNTKRKNTNAPAYGYFWTGMLGRTGAGFLASGPQRIYDNPTLGSTSIIFSAADTPATGILYNPSSIQYTPGYNSSNGQNSTGWQPSRILIKKPGIYAIGYTVGSQPELNNPSPFVTTPIQESTRSWALTLTPSTSNTQGIYPPGTGNIINGTSLIGFSMPRTSYILEINEYAANMNMFYVSIPKLPNGQPVAIDITCVNLNDNPNRSNRFVTLQGGLTNTGNNNILDSAVAASLMIIQIG